MSEVLCVLCENFLRPNGQGLQCCVPSLLPGRCPARKESNTKMSTNPVGSDPECFKDIGNLDPSEGHPGASIKIGLGVSSLAEDQTQGRWAHAVILKRCKGGEPNREDKKKRISGDGFSWHTTSVSALLCSKAHFLQKWKTVVWFSRCLYGRIVKSMVECMVGAVLLWVSDASWPGISSQVSPGDR